MTQPADRSNLPVLRIEEPQFWQDIHAPIAAAMEDSPFALTSDGLLYALRAETVESVLKDPQFEAADLLAMMGMTEGPAWEWWSQVMFSQNPPEHTRLRSLVSRAFTPRAVEALRPGIRARAEEILLPALEKNELDAQNDLGHRLPLAVMSDMLGVPEADREAFGGWTTDLGLVFGAAVDPEIRTQVEASLAELEAYVRNLIAERRRKPGDDLLSKLIAVEEAGDRLSEAELIVMVLNLMFAGHDTTRGALGAMVMLMAQHADQFEAVSSDQSLLSSAVDEVLRYEAITFGTSRLASQDVELGGVRIAAGEPVGVCLAAASRDPRRYDAPNTFDVSRSDIRPPTFGAGVHYCLGAALARAEMEEALAVLTQRCRSIELVEEPRWLPLAHIRRFESSLLVRLVSA
jgi:cytochrome P450